MRTYTHPYVHSHVCTLYGATWHLYSDLQEMLQDIALDSFCSIRAVGNNIRFVPYVTLGVADNNNNPNPNRHEDTEVMFATLKTAVVSSVQALSSKIWCFQCQSKGIPGINIHVYICMFIHVCTLL